MLTSEYTEITPKLQINERLGVDGNDNDASSRHAEAEYFTLSDRHI